LLKDVTGKKITLKTGYNETTWIYSGWPAKNMNQVIRLRTKKKSLNLILINSMLIDEIKKKIQIKKDKKKDLNQLD
jgi:methylaspartate ammonia-lyase